MAQLRDSKLYLKSVFEIAAARRDPGLRFLSGIHVGLKLAKFSQRYNLSLKDEQLGCSYGTDTEFLLII